MGLFLSINGWVETLPAVLKQHRRKCIILMDGNDLNMVLKGMIDLQELIRAKVEKLNYKTEPFYGAEDYLKDNPKA